MEYKYKNLFKNDWWRHLNSNTGIILSDDLDSLFSYMGLQTRFNCYISSFYDFKNKYKLIGVKEPEREIGVDIDLMDNQYTFSNHVTRPNANFSCNKNAINLNSLFNICGEDPEIYHLKYAGSTFIMILGLYNFDVNSLSEEAKMVTLCIDGFYGSYFSPYKRDNESCKKFLDLLGLNCLYDVLKRHKINEFKDIIQKYKLNSKIKINDHKLQIDCNLFELSLIFGFKIFNDWIELPANKLELQKQYKTGYGVSNEVRRLLNSSSKLVSIAVTSRNYSSFSYY